MIMATVKTNISFPKFVFQEDLRQIAQKIFIPEMQMAIDRQVGVDGTSYPALEPETLKKKRGDVGKRLFTKSGKIRETASKTIAKVGLSGFNSKTLIQTGNLRSSFIMKNRGKSTVIVTLDSDRKNIGKYLQIDGVGKKRKKFNFFGISLIMEAKAIQYMKNKIKDAIDGRTR